jgi:hypothetical protein
VRITRDKSSVGRKRNLFCCPTCRVYKSYYAKPAVALHFTAQPDAIELDLGLRTVGKSPHLDYI